MKKLFFLILFLPFLIFAQSSKKYPSLLWKISGNGLKKPSYLYGTMHVSNRVAYYLSEQFFEAIKSVDAVGLETNPGEWLNNMELTGELSQLSQFRGPEYYSNDFYRSAFSVSFPEKKMLQGILGYDPDIIDGLLYRQNHTKENFEENTYIDLFIFQTAAKLNKQLISLEDFAQSEIQARLSALPDDETGLDEESSYKDYTSGMQKIEDAYRDGNLDMLDSLSKLSSSKNTQRYLIENRNVFFVNTIDSVLKTRSLFSGVGAAHLPGENGVIELLRKKGYQVEAVFSKVSKKSSSLIEKLDAQVKPVSFQKQFLSDSVFSVNVPGKLTPIVNLENLRYYIYADMVNGSFYTIVRLKYLGPLFNVSAAQMAQKIDSLLFEYIPGKITLKKDIVSNTGLKGIEIVNKTRRGDEQHYQIFFTELEMILFKLGGKNTYATGGESRQFFNSIQFINKPEHSMVFTPRNGGFSVKLPANYTYVKNEGSSLIGIAEELFAYHKSKNIICGVKQAVYNDFNYLEEDTFELNQFSKNILNNYNFKESVSYQPITEQGLPGMQFKGKNKLGSNFYGKLVIKGVHYYLVYLISQKETDFENELFTSFKLSDFVYTNPLKEVTDHDFHFKAKDEVTDNALSRFNEAYTRAFEATRTKKDTVQSNDYEYRTGTKFYYSPSSNEYVNITFEKYNDYDYFTAKDLEEKTYKNIKTFAGLNSTNIKTNHQKGIYTYESVLKDTATSRAIALKIYIKNGMRYDISAAYDTISGLKGWTKGFMDSFEPEDTVIGKNIFENKFPKLLNDLAGKDTLAKRAADNSIQGNVSMQKAYANDFVEFISGNKLGSVNEASRAQLFVNGGTLESDRIIVPYKNLYKQYTDSFYLQLCLLKGLTFLKTQNSYNAIYDLLLTETPLVGAEGTISDVFAAMHDSLELCRKFFPGMLTLAKYDEYRETVYSLLAELVQKKIIQPQAYAQQKDGILADANLALKRYNSSGAKVSAAESNNFDYLEKSAKELAESIQVNLEGLANNNLYKGTGYLRSTEVINRPALVNYAFLLSPFYRNDEKVKQFFTKTSRIKAQNIAMPVAINLLKHNVVINDTLLEFYAKNKITRAFFYSELEKEKLTDRFDKKYLDQQSLVESVLSSRKQLSNFYTYENKNKKDSLVLIRIVDAHNKYQKGKLYIYKGSKTKVEDEQWSAAFVNHSKETVTSKMEIVSSNFAVDKSKSEQENINELLNYFYLSFRKRATLNNNSSETY